MTAPQHKFKVVPETIHHKPTVVTVREEPDPYPINPRWPPDPAIYAPPLAIDCRELDEEMGR